MSTYRFQVAKFVPDLLRDEPRNIGIILWSRERVVARFLGEKPERPGEVDGRSIPAFVTDPSVYRQWVRFWQAEIKKPGIEPIRGGALIPRASDAFLPALRESGRGSYVLVDGGDLLDIGGDDEVDLHAALMQLYTALVDSGGAVEEPVDPSLDELCDRYVSESGLFGDPNFHANYGLECSWKQGVSEHFEFSYAYRNGTLQRLYHRLPFPKRRGALRKVIHDSAWMFEKVTQAQLIGPNQGAVLLHATEEQVQEPEVQSALRVLESVTRVFNVAAPDPLLAELRGLAQLPH